MFLLLVDVHSYDMICIQCITLDESITKYAIIYIPGRMLRMLPKVFLNLVLHSYGMLFIQCITLDESVCYHLHTRTDDNLT